jgi:integrase
MNDSAHPKPSWEAVHTQESGHIADQPEDRAQDLEGMDWLQDLSYQEPSTYTAKTNSSRVIPVEGAGQPEFGAVVPGRDGWLIKESTAQSYRKRAERLWRAAAEKKARLSGDLEAPALIKPKDVVEYLQWRRLPQPGLPPISEATWYSYRSALLWDFSRTQEPEFSLACKELESLAISGKDDNGGAPAAPRYNKKGGIKAADLTRLIDQLGTMNRKRGWGRRTQYWLQAGIATGLRPGEWEFARWADEAQNLLIAPTFKVKASPAAYARASSGPQGQEGSLEPQAATTPNQEISGPLSTTPARRPEPPSHYPLRAVPVEPGDRLFVAEHLNSIQEAAEAGCNFEMYQEYCRQTLWRACRQLWGGTKLYALYQARHQFSANSRGKMSKDDLAVALGHSRKSTSARWYAGHLEAHRKNGGVKMHMGQAQQGQVAQEAPSQQALAPAGSPGLTEQAPTLGLDTAQNT